MESYPIFLQNLSILHSESRITQTFFLPVMGIKRTENLVNKKRRRNYVHVNGIRNLIVVWWLDADQSRIRG